jgi:exodeoxyribonuclease VII large subunit
VAGPDENSLMPEVTVSVSEFVALLNQTYDFAFPSITIVGELANFKISRNKWVYFDLKDDEASVRFFGTVYMLPGPLEDGLMMQVRGTPHMHERFGFSVSVQTMQPVGEGALKRAAELLSAKLQTEGLFDEARKRPVPYPPQHIGLITSAQSAAYADFIKVIGARWGGLQIDLIDVQVQGEAAPDMIVRAIEQFNELKQPPEVLVVIRGGGSADDLAAFSTESVVRAVAASRVPTFAAIGHETDLSLTEMAADLRASTPSNLAELLVPDRQTVLRTLRQNTEDLHELITGYIDDERGRLDDFARDATLNLERAIKDNRTKLQSAAQLLKVLSPQAALKRGYAIVRRENGQLVRTADDAPEGVIVHISVDGDDISAMVTGARKRAA